MGAAAQAIPPSPNSEALFMPGGVLVYISHTDLCRPQRVWFLRRFGCACKELKEDERITCLAPHRISFIRGGVLQVLQGV